MKNTAAFEVLFDARYRIMFTERDEDLVAIAVSNLEYGVNRIEQTFKVKANIPFVNVFLCPSRLVFDEFLRVITKTPTDSGRIGTPQGHDMYILSPKSYRSDAPYYGRDDPPFFDPIDFKRILIHELVHLWNELSSPREAMDEGDDWLDAGMAMYISEWCREPREERRLRADYSNGIVPKPDEISGEQNYTWGCVLVEFLLKEIGARPLMDLIMKTNHHSVIELLGFDQSVFWERYSEFVHLRM